MIRKNLADKYGIDVNQIKKLEDMAQYFDKIKNGESGVAPFGVDRNGPFNLMLRYNNMGELLRGILAVNLNEPFKVVSLVDTAEYKQYTALMRKWYETGYINEDAPTLKKVEETLKLGKAATRWHDTLKPGGELENMANFGGKELQFIKLTEPYASPTGPTSTINAISRASRNPERAMMFLNLVQTDSELFNVLCYGVEGKHFTKNADGSVHINTEAGYNPNANWVFGNSFYAYLPEGQDPKAFEETRKLNETVAPYPLSGFTLNIEPITAEIRLVPAWLDQCRGFGRDSSI